MALARDHHSPDLKRMKKYYFSKFEDRIPYTPVKDSGLRSTVFQVSGVLSILAGLIYLYWRGAYSLNPGSPVFSTSLYVAELFSFVGICLMVFDLWKGK